MRTFNAAFQQYVINDRSADMRFTIEVQWDEAGTELVYFLSHSDSGAPVGATTIHSIHSISSTSQSLNNRYAIAEIGSLTFMLADVADGITDELASRFDSGITAVRKKATVYAGTVEMDFVDYEPIDTWYISDISHTGPGYQFKASDIQRFLRQKIFIPDKSRLSASMTATQTHIPLTVALTSTLFPAVTHDSSYTYNPSVSVGYVKIEDEIIAHDGTVFNHGTDGPSLGVVGRGALNTKAAAHKTDDSADEDKGKEVTEIIYVEGKAVDLIHLVMTGENVDGTATIPDHWNAGIDTDLIDATTFGEINTELTARRYSFIAEKEQDAKQFIEQQLQRFYGLFQTVTSQGTFKLHRYERTLEETSPVAYVVDRQIVSIGNLNQREQDVINVYGIDYNLDYLSERFTRGLNYLDASSYNANGRLIKNESFQFRGVRTALHSDNDVRNFIYQTRELYSNPPFRTSVKLNNENIGIEVGDVINIETSVRKNYVTGTANLNRPFLVSRRSIDFGKREISLELIGTGLKAEAILDPGAVGSTGELTTAYITGTGTNLETHANVSSGVLTGNVTLTGTSNANAAASIWYLDDDLVIPNGRTLTIVNNVQLRITGQIAVENGGTLTGAGNGIAGATFGNTASPGYFGSTKAGCGERIAQIANWGETANYGGVRRNTPDEPVVNGQVQALPFFNLRNEDGVLTGLPNDLRGTPGGPGGENGPSVGVGDGGDGGDSGAGLITISRGLTIGATATVNLSGDNGVAGDTVFIPFSSGSVEIFAGGGAGGCPGGWLCIIDGDYSGPTSDQITATRGSSPNSSPRPQNITGFKGGDMAAAALRVQYVPARKVVEDDGATGIRTLSTPTGLTLENGPAIGHEGGNISEYILATWNVLTDSGAEYYQLRAKRTSDPDYIIAAIVPDDEAEAGALIAADYGVQYSVQIRAYGPNVQASAWSSAATFTVTSEVPNPSDVTGFILSQNGELVNFFWNLISDANRDGYVLRYGPVGCTWEDATPLLNEGKGTKVTTAYVPNGNYDFLIKAINLQRKYSTNATRYNFTVAGLLDIINETEHAPLWDGTLSGYVRHYTGKLIPEDQNLANTYGDEIFDELVPNPVASSSFESNEIDSGVESLVRIWAVIDSYLGYGETGIADPQLYVDYRGISYDGFEQWSLAEVEARYAKFRLVNDNTQGVAVIRGFRTVLDSRERVERGINVVVAPGGTAVLFDTPFRLTPYIEVGAIGTGGLISESASDSTTGFTFHIYNSSGTSVGGTGKWQAIGV